MQVLSPLAISLLPFGLHAGLELYYRSRYPYHRNWNTGSDTEATLLLHSQHNLMAMYKSALWAAVLSVLLVPASSLAQVDSWQTFSAQVVEVKAGETSVPRSGGRRVTIRLQKVDAGE